MEKIVYVVHSIDTEGPLYESIQATFKRIETYYNIKLEPTKANLEKIRNGQIPLKGKEQQAARMFSKELLSYVDDYHKLEKMLDNITSSEFRNGLLDSFGNGWVYSWHCVDHLDYTYNPRRKDIGMHNVFDFYSNYIFQNNLKDRIHWHYHPSHHSKASHFNATNYLIDTKFYEIIAHRILERDWFPAVNRAGFHMERPDSHWMLEQWIPFDLSNQATTIADEQDDLAGGRFGDWRRATIDWTVYHPDQDDYQIKGSSRRHIGKCLNIGTRIRCIDQNEVNSAFELAESSGKALLSITNHDFRDMAPDVIQMREYLKIATEKYPEVKFKYCDSLEAFNLHQFDEFVEPKENILKIELKDSLNEGQKKLYVSSTEKTFGPQPFLAIKLVTGEIHYSNFDFQIPFREWTYVFDHQTFPIETVAKIGVATNDCRGFNHIRTIEFTN